jgi:hypothetical protein
VTWIPKCRNSLGQVPEMVTISILVRLSLFPPDTLGHNALAQGTTGCNLRNAHHMYASLAISGDLV